MKDRGLYLTYIRHVITVQRVWRGALVSSTIVLFYFCPMMKKISPLFPIVQYLKGRMCVRCRLAAIIKLQAWIRMILARRRLARFFQSALVIQKSYRCYRCYSSFVLMKRAIVQCQSCVRGWLVRCLVSAELVARLLSSRQHLFNLWKHAFVPLSYRSVDGWQQYTDAVVF